MISSLQAASRISRVTSTIKLTVYQLLGGTAACLTASRLADADPNLQILVVEAGPHTQNDLQHIQPARFLTHITPSSTTATFMIANPEEELGGRQTIVPAGSCVGGGSSINCEELCFTSTSTEMMMIRQS
jgi:hypothetical protein